MLHKNESPGCVGAQTEAEKNVPLRADKANNSQSRQLLQGGPDRHVLYGELLKDRARVDALIERCTELFADIQDAVSLLQNEKALRDAEIEMNCEAMMAGLHLMNALARRVAALETKGAV